MKGALVGGAVTEEGHGDVFPVLHLDGQAAAGGDGDATAHDGVSAQIALGEVGDVHRAAAALAVAGGLAHQLRQGPVQLCALGDAVAVPPVRGCDVVLVRQLSTDRGCHSFLAGV